MKTQNYLWICDKASWITSRFPFVNPEVANFIACQFALESSYGKSTIAIENHNISGMKMPTKRLSCALCEKRDHAVYSSIYTCMMDYFYWCQSNSLNQSSFKDLSTFIIEFPFSKYCPNPNYSMNITSLFNQFKSQNYE